MQRVEVEKPAGELVLGRYSSLFGWVVRLVCLVVSCFCGWLLLGLVCDFFCLLVGLVGFSFVSLVVWLLLLVYLTICHVLDIWEKIGD